MPTVQRGYDNLARTGTRSSVNSDPRRIEEDITEKIHRLDPESTPLQFLSKMIGRGEKPKNHKVQMIMYDSFDHFDKGTIEFIDNTQNNRFARLNVQQISRPTTSNFMTYYPQDTFFVPETGQNLEVLMTPFAQIEYGGGGYTTNTTLTGTGSTSASADSTVVVREITGQPIRTFSNSTLVWKGRTIRESQNVGGQSLMEDFTYDCNFVEHKESVLTFTEDQKKWVKTKGSMPDFNFQQQEMIARFKKSVEYTFFFGERAVNFDVPSRPTRYMRGLINHIQSNVSIYNPYASVDFEQLVLNFMSEQAFRHNPHGKNKVMMCGEKFLTNFNLAFREFRRMDINDKQASPGLDISTYTIPGGFNLKIMRNDVFRGPEMEHWGLVFDAAEAEFRTVKDYESRPYSLPNERDIKYLIEWQGTIAWNRQEAHALLRTP